MTKYFKEVEYKMDTDFLAKLDKAFIHFSALVIAQIHK